MWKDGIYLSQARGMAGFVKTKLEISNNKITSVNLDLYTETPQYAQKAKSKLENEVLAKQSADIYAVSGATFTSNGVKEAVKDALKKAEK
ncbi:FMN-binding protein [Lactobacillus kitasatonis]|uniref:FMN-binding protein n=1 Tax=Lactobacillus kitasatonis TaxID=237446 RepID=A0ABS1LVA8_9LACO|nr:FMN-binding protein [Lactobacillus kitasatonis]MBL1072207.1 FMN-binding protein [Lactobacillus kitasatonis]